MVEIRQCSLIRGAAPDVCSQVRNVEHDHVFTDKISAALGKFETSTSACLVQFIYKKMLNYVLYP